MGDGNKVGLTKSYILSGMDMLERYLISYDSAENLFIYKLPNGSLIYTDTNGNVARIEEKGITSDVGHYQFIYDKYNNLERIKLSDGISIDLINGLLTVENDTTFEVLTQAISSDWLSSVNLFNGMTVRLTRSLQNGTVVQEWETKLVKSTMTSGSKEYYYLEGLQPTVNNVVNDSSGTVYYIIEHDTASKTVKFYQTDRTGQYSITNYETFKNLMVDKNKVETHNGYFRDKQSKTEAFGGNGHAD